MRIELILIVPKTIIFPLNYINKIIKILLILKLRLKGIYKMILILKLKLILKVYFRLLVKLN